MSSFKRFIKNNTRNRYAQRQSVMLTATLSVLVMFLVSFVLTKPADSMTGQLICASEAHAHDDSCYELICGYDLEEESEMNTSESVENSSETLETAVQHEHNDDCFRLACEKNEHSHSQDCYESLNETVTTENEENFLSVIYKNDIVVADDGDSADTADAEGTTEVTSIEATANVEYFEEVVKEIPDVGTKINITQYLVDTSELSTGMVYPNNEFNSTIATTDFKLSFSIPASSLRSANQPVYLYYELPEGLTFTDEKCGNDAFITDKAHSAMSAYYSKTNVNGKGLWVLRVKEDYFNEYINTDNASDFKCTYDFTGNVERLNTNAGDRNLTYAIDITDTVKFTDYTKSIYKYGIINSTTGCIDWTIDIKDNTVDNDFTNAVLEDNMLSQIKDGTFQTSIEGILTENADNTYTFNRDFTGDEKQLLIYYSTPLDDNIKIASGKYKYENTVNITNTNNDVLTYTNSVDVEAAASISKGGYFDYNYYEDPKIENKSVWVINAQTRYNLPFGGYKIVDANFANAIDFIVYNAQTNEVVTDYTLSGDTLTLSDNIDFNKIKIVYKTDNTIKSNEAKIVYPVTNADGPSATGNIWDEKYDPSVAEIKTKEGIYDYISDADADAKPAIEGKFIWNINIVGKYDIPVNGYYIVDNMFAGLTSDDFEIFDLTTAPHTKITDFTVSGDKLTLGDSITSDDVMIYYRTPVTNEVVTTNTATLYSAANLELDSMSVIKYDTIEGYKPFDIVPDVSFDKKTNTITRTYKVIPAWNSTVGTVYDSVLTVDMLKGLTEDDFECSIDSTEYDFNMIYDSESGTITVEHGDTDLPSVNEYTITIKTEATEQDIKDLKDDKIVTFSATGRVNHETYGNYVEKTTSKQYQGKTTVTKSLNTSNSSPDFSVESTDKIFSLAWKVEIKRDYSFNTTNETFVDVISAINSDTDEPSTQADHYIASAQRGNIKVQARIDNGSYTDLIEGTDYDITFYENIESDVEAAVDAKSRRFAIVFKQTVEDAGYNQVLINYDTTADMTNVTEVENIKFNNTASYNDATDTPDNVFTPAIYDPDNPGYKKYAMDKNGEKIDTSEDAEEVVLKNLEIASIDGVDYYIFRWRIDFEDRDSVRLSFKDKIQDGFTLCTDAQYKPLIKYDVNTSATEMWYKPDWGYSDECYYYDSTNGEVYFYKIGNSIAYINYCTKIPVADFDAKFTDVGVKVNINNKLENIEFNDNNNIFAKKYNDISVSYDVVKSADEITYDYLKKSYVPHKDLLISNALTYSIDINKNAENLANGDQILLSDIFTSDIPVDTLLDSLTIYEIDNKTNTETLLDVSEYMYQFNNEGKDYSVSMGSTIRDNNFHKFMVGSSNPNIHDGSILGDLLQGDVITLKFSCPDLINSTHSKHTYSIWAYPPGSGAGTETQRTIEIELSFDENGDAYFTYVNPGNYSKIEFIFWIKDDYYNNLNFTTELVSVVRHDAFAELQVTLPDSKHLRMEYVYKVLQNGKEPPNNSTISFNNTATIQADKSSTSSVKDNEITFYYGSGDSYTDTYPVIKKYDVSDYSITGLNASFRLAEYDTDTNSWKWCNEDDLTFNGVSPVTIDPTTWGDAPKEFTTNGGKFMIDGLRPGKLYVLDETVEPQANENAYGYKYEDASDNSKVAPYYFSYGSKIGTYPTGIDGEVLSDSNVAYVTLGDIIRVTNNRIIDVTVTKEWDRSQASPKIQVGLYWSHKKVINGFPDDIKLAEASDLNVDAFDSIVEFDGASYTWHDLPNGIDGKPIYYYVKELSYTVGGITYTADSTGVFKASDGVTVGQFIPLYTGNATCRTQDTVSIVNAGALRVQKYWYDAKNRELPDQMKTSEIRFKIWGSKVEGGNEYLIPNPEDNSEEFVLSADNNWTYEFSEDSLKDYKYFRVLETTDPGDGFTVEYSGLYEGHKGKLSIINKSDVSDPTVSIKINKKWIAGKDGSGNLKTGPTPEFIVLHKIDSDITWTEVSGLSAPTPPTSENNYYIYEVPYRDQNGNIYSYQIKEAPMAGYKTTYPNGYDVKNGEVEIVNTKVFDVTVNKEWIESYKSNHDDKSITVYLMRSRQFTDVNSTSTVNAYREVQLSAVDNWHYVFSDCEAYEENSNEEYYYWIVEAPVAGYNTTYTYTGNDIRETSDAYEYFVDCDATVLITNSYIYEPVMLPATGGRGTIKYYIIGAAIVLIGCAGLIVSKKLKVNKK